MDLINSLFGAIRGTLKLVVLTTTKQAATVKDFNRALANTETAVLGFFLPLAFAIVVVSFTMIMENHVGHNKNQDNNNLDHFDNDNEPESQDTLNVLDAQDIDTDTLDTTTINTQKARTTQEEQLAKQFIDSAQATTWQQILTLALDEKRSHLSIPDNLKVAFSTYLSQHIKITKLENKYSPYQDLQVIIQEYQALLNTDDTYAEAAVYLKRVFNDHDFVSSLFVKHADASSERQSVIQNIISAINNITKTQATYLTKLHKLNKAYDSAKASYEQAEHYKQEELDNFVIAQGDTSHMNTRQKLKFFGKHN